MRIVRGERQEGTNPQVLSFAAPLSKHVHHT